MPLARYFGFVGGVLLVLLFVADFNLPKTQTFAKPDEVDRSPIRINSDKKWPERIVFDSAQNSISVQQKPAPVADPPAVSLPQEAFAQAIPPGAKPAMAAAGKQTLRAPRVDPGHKAALRLHPAEDAAYSIRPKRTIQLGR